MFAFVDVYEHFLLLPFNSLQSSWNIPDLFSQLMNQFHHLMFIAIVVVMIVMSVMMREVMLVPMVDFMQLPWDARKVKKAHQEDKGQ